MLSVITAIMNVAFTILPYTGFSYSESGTGLPLRQNQCLLKCGTTYRRKTVTAVQEWTVTNELLTED